ncbi:hypothetical protein AUJ66_08765 [Candidatus Desantisbacteria bacterium CG1_02_38_46]|uniref:DUF6876 domain-containing protein n=2 Tax=unclassified Candidatus Desantisiibacteriota TaxID=3106372 RepID=A0A1J4S891_9BACT|nr:MAG: hypothetical protein AUJ66_08765 [Candidatus Desantisbacteria bacterium CG1_02_38_46]PIU51027.1 MAG: hypothetical protein COS91_06505 [Candidatus Desantisbacteria bacterium CG07_land_8_20_14_0_80_39_15]
MTSQEELNLVNVLSGFTGTEKYHKSTFGRLLLTDGMHYLRETANCYWLIDIVESVQEEKAVKEHKDFIIWKIEVGKGDHDKDNKNKWQVTAWSDIPYKSEMLYCQNGDFTDFPLEEFEFYQTGEVLLLKSEY